MEFFKYLFNTHIFNIISFKKSADENEEYMSIDQTFKELYPKITDFLFFAAYVIFWKFEVFPMKFFGTVRQKISTENSDTLFLSMKIFP